MSKLHHILQLYKREAVNETHFESVHLNNTLFGKEEEEDLDDFHRSYKDRVLLFEKNCALFRKVHFFLFESINNLFLMSNETVAVFKDFTEYKAVRNDRTNATVNNMTIDSFGISKEYALKDYIITSEDLEAAIEDVKLSLLDDPLLTELENTTQVTDELIDMEMNEADSVSIIEYWLLGMENNTIDYFTEAECSGFEDCVLYAFSVLYGLYTDASFVDSELNRNLTSSIENQFLTLLQNTTTPVTSVCKQAINIIDDLSVLNSSHMFCAVAPNITNSMNNVAVLLASDVKLVCEAIGEPTPQLKWYHNDMLLEGESKSILELINISTFNQGM
jgi:hypothetical protein